MTGLRFQVTYSNQTIFVDRLRFGCDTDLDRTFLGACADNPENVDLVQQPVMFDIPKQDFAAYRRACAAFNAVMDEHERTIEQKNARRRARHHVPTPNYHATSIGAAGC